MPTIGLLLAREILDNQGCERFPLNPRSWRRSLGVLASSKDGLRGCVRIVSDVKLV